MKTVVFTVDERMLASVPGRSDRFVYSRHFVPYQITFAVTNTPAFDLYGKFLINGVLTDRPWLYGRVTSNANVGYAERFKDVLNVNGIKIEPNIVRPGGEGDPVAIRPSPGGLSLSTHGGPLAGVLTRPDGDASPYVTRSGPLLTFLKWLTGWPPAEWSSRHIQLSIQEAEVDSSPRQDSGSGHTFTSAPLSEFLSYAPTGDVDYMLQIMKSNFGFLFLDRTRIRPSGFALGEHVYALGLAPGEEIVIEQKAFTKRQETFEDETQLEREFNLEMSSTLTTELQEGMQRQQSISETLGLTVGASVGVPVEGVTVEESVGASDTITAADALTTSQSVKQSQTTSSKVAAKYRALHKTVFKITTERGFETTSRRVIRNPNKFTPATLHYFKILQSLYLRQERYGVRLAWAPCVTDPGSGVEERIGSGRQRIINDAVANVPVGPAPEEPPVPAYRPDRTTSGRVDVGEYDLEWGVLGGLSHDYVIGIPIPQGYKWDLNGESVKQSVKMHPDKWITRPYHFYPTGEPESDSMYVRIKVHVGISDDKVGSVGTFWLEAAANFRPRYSDEDISDQARYADWQRRHAEWAAHKAAAQTQARAEATAEADKWAAEELARVNPVAEMLGRVAAHLFPAELRADCWQLDVWQKIFDWDMASYKLYPSWWTRPFLRDPKRPPTDFLNASFAKVYLPVRPGYEHLALRFIHGGVVDQPLEGLEEEFTVLVEELDKYRRENFGVGEVNLDGEHAPRPMTDEDADGCPTVKEKFLCLGRWKEFLPTDGTHAEVVLGMTSAADETSRAEADTSARHRAAAADSLAQDVEIKKKAVETIQSTTSGVSVSVSGFSHGD